MKKLMTAAAVSALLMSLAQAGQDWLRWNDSNRGSPTILFSSDGLELTVPEGTMAEAAALGLSGAQAITAFLNRYAAHVCNRVGPDMNIKHSGLVVKVILTQKDERYLPAVFFVPKGEPVTYVVDYAPEDSVQCSHAIREVPQY